MCWSSGAANWSRIVAEGNRARQLTSAQLKKRIARHRGVLQKDLSEIQRELDETIRATPIWLETHELLTSVPGVGNTLARTMIAAIPELGTITGRQAAALAGVAPFNRDSGHGAAGAWYGGRAGVRRVLCLAAVTASRCNQLSRPSTNACNSRANQPSSPSSPARKLLTILNAIVRERRPWTHQLAWY
jgi:transposase